MEKPRTKTVQTANQVKSEWISNTKEKPDITGGIIGIQNRLNENSIQLFAIRGYIQLMKCYFQDEHFQEQSGLSEEHFFGIIDLSQNMLNTLDSAMEEISSCNDSLGGIRTELKEVK